MTGSPANKSSSQIVIDFEQIKWPNQEDYPLNIKSAGRTVESVIYNDIARSSDFLIITGFTSLSNLIDLFGSQDHLELRHVRVLIGFEPNLKGRKVYLRYGLEKEIKDYWIKRGLSILQGGAVIHLIEKIKQGWIDFRFKDKLHGKIYVGDYHATLGSSNFSRNGLNTQDEANIRVSAAGETKEQYRNIRMIAESFFDEASNYNEKLIGLLEALIKDVTWEEALARAIAEMLEGSWLNEYKEIITRISGARLWPTQWKGLAQAISILQNQSNVLIADPTGAGKTKLCTALVLCLQHLLYETGRHHRTESLIICPPLVLKKWADEFHSFGKINHNQISMGMLSNGSIENKERIVTQLKVANLLVIDEAHSYLADSGRTHQIKANRADHKILITATPISRRVEDVLSLVKLLDVDNLKDDAFEVYQELIRKPYRGDQMENVAMLRSFISQFTIRRTKRRLNEEIEKDQEAYKNKLKVICKFPEQKERTYKTKETAADKLLVGQIGELAKKIKGITYLTRFKLSEIGDEENPKNLNLYVDRRIFSARALSIYMIRYALRSSHIALVEHIEGSEKAMLEFKFQGKSKGTGDKLQKIKDIINEGILPYRQKKFSPDLFPSWLIEEAEYFAACQRELETYQEIARLAKQFSGQRELGKVEELIKASKMHRHILAFDSTVITLYYLRQLFNEHYPNQQLLVATGSEKDRDSLKVLDVFKLDAQDKVSYIALCSDKMSESVDLQKASCVFLLDTPSVLRIVEQRIGRADRMDSMHKTIDIFWAHDSPEYSLKGDERLIETNHVVDLIYGSNFKVPDILKGQRFTATDSAEALIEEYKEFVDKDESWTGVVDRFQSIRNLKEGREALISEALYEQFAEVKSEVKTKVSFIAGSGDWCFIALRGDQRKSPRWYFIDRDDHIHTEIQEVCGLLRQHIKKDSTRLKWDANTLSRYVKVFKTKERQLLPAKKGRALAVAEYILGKRKQKGKLSTDMRKAIETMQSLIQGRSTEVVDYDILADEWIVLLQPYLDTKREAIKNEKKECNLNSLKREHEKIKFEADQLILMAEQSIIADAIDKRIAACIIAVGS